MPYKKKFYKKSRIKKSIIKNSVIKKITDPSKMCFFQVARAGSGPHGTAAPLMS